MLSWCKVATRPALLAMSQTVSCTEISSKVACASYPMLGVFFGCACNMRRTSISLVCGPMQTHTLQVGLQEQPLASPCWHLQLHHSALCASRISGLKSETMHAVGSFLSQDMIITFGLREGMLELQGELSE